MANNRSIRQWTSVVILASLSAPAMAQWVEQDIELQEGWNSVFLEVDPAPAAPDELFRLGATPFEAVWAFVEDTPVEIPPECTDPDSEECAPAVTSSWQVWLPPDHPAHVTCNLFWVRGARVCLIKTAAAGTWTITGKPNGTATHWRQGFNLAGFHVVDEPAATPTFAEYLAPSAAHAPVTIYSLPADGSAPVNVSMPSTARITPHRGYWVKTRRDTVYDGPIAVDESSLRGIDFAISLVDHWLEVENLGASTATVTVATRSSTGVPSSDPPLPSLAGDVPLQWLDYDQPGGCGTPEHPYQWCDLLNESWALPASGTEGSSQTIRLAVRRPGLAAAELDAHGQGAEYQSLLEVSDGNGYRHLIPVTTQVKASLAGAVARGGAFTLPEGLYVGTVIVDKVAWIHAAASMWTDHEDEDDSFVCTINEDGTDDCPPGQTCVNDICADLNDPSIGRIDDPDGTVVPRPVRSPFEFPVIVHVASDGTYKLLKDVTVMWRPGDPGSGTPGSPVLVTSECAPEVLATLEAGSRVGGEEFSPRISTAAFSFDGDLLMTEESPGVLKADITIPPGHPLNPFRHKYHPAHDCDQAGECYEIKRLLWFTLSAEPPAGGVTPGWGDKIFGGTYRETLDKVHKSPIELAGSFELHRAFDVAVLNGGS